MFKRMNTTWFKAHWLFVITLSIALAHFVVTSVVGHYIAVHVGTQVGHVVAEGFIQAYEKSPQNLQKSEEEAKRIHQEMKNKSESIIENWKLPLFVISLPVKPLMNPFLKSIRDARIRKFLYKEMSKEQFYKWGIITDYTATFINSFFVGFLVYLILRLLRHYKLRT